MPNKTVYIGDDATYGATRLTVIDGKLTAIDADVSGGSRSMWYPVCDVADIHPAVADLIAKLVDENLDLYEKLADLSELAS